MNQEDRHTGRILCAECREDGGVLGDGLPMGPLGWLLLLRSQAPEEERKNDTVLVLRTLYLCPSCTPLWVDMEKVAQAWRDYVR